MDTIILGKSGFVGKSFDIQNAICPSKKECNLLNYNSVYKYFKKYENKKINIINLSAKVAGFTYNKNHNVEMLYDNTLIHLNLIKVLKELNIKTYMIYVASVCCYDQSFNELKIFDGKPNKLNFGYGFGKKNGIYALEAYQIDNPNNIDYCVLVPSNMYGENDNFNSETSHIIPNMIRQMYNSQENIHVLGNCLNKRDFLYVKDFGNIIKLCFKNKITGIYNISSNKAVSIKNIVLKLKDIIEYKGELIFSTKEKQNNRKISNAKLLKKIKYEFTDLHVGLNNTVKYYEKIRN
jgi:GDP-L-fucose synthase